MRLLSIIALAILLAAAAPAGAAMVTVYSNDFDGPVVFGTGVTGGLSGFTGTESVQSLPLGFSGKLLRNPTGGGGGTLQYTTLTLNNLPAHTAVDINCLFAFIDSWDSTNGSPAPDWFNVKVDGTLVLQITAANASGSNTYGGNQIGFAQFGWTYGWWGDRAFDMSGEPALLLAHTASTLRVEFFASGAGWQGGNDESWAIENLKVEVAPVPVPASLLLLAPGLAGLAAAKRRFRK